MARSKSSPVGIPLGHKGQYRVGKCLGQGAQAAVHVVLDKSGKETVWAVKLAPLPKKKTKRGVSMPEVNAGSIFKESLLYQNHFPTLRGTILPKNPVGTDLAVYGEQDGFRFLIMERMEAPLLSFLPEVVSANRSSSSIKIGPLAACFMNIIREIHDKQHLLVDVKPDNFMLARPNKKKKNEDCTSRIRLVDLGLFDSFIGPYGYRENEGGHAVRGTPLYASLNLHAGHTPSRRDDMEATIYVLAEIILRLQAALHGTTADYEADGGIPSYLPWSQATSDEELGRIKNEQVTNKRSAFYKSMPAPAGKIVWDCLQEIFSYSFKKKPDYASLQEKLSGLQVPVAAAAKKKKTKKAPAAAKKSPKSGPKRRRSPGSRYRLESDSDDEELPPKVAKAGGAMDDDMDYVMVDVDDDDDDDGVVPMDTEEEDRKPAAKPSSRRSPRRRPTTRAAAAREKENVAAAAVPAPASAKKKTKKSKVLPAIVQIISGPYEGDEYVLEPGVCDTLCVGSKPTTRKGHHLALPKDTLIEANHVRLELKSSSRVCKVNVTDLSTSAGTVLGSKQIGKGDYRMAFADNVIKVGETTMKISLPES